MKTFTFKSNWRLAALSAVVVAAGLVGSALRVEAQTSPAGTWDLVLSGSQRGLAQLTFDEGTFTVTGTEIVTVKPRSGSSRDVNPRGGLEDDERGDIDMPSTNSTVGMNIYGRAGLSGFWTYDNKLRIVGVLIEDGGTNHFTNGISFRAVVKHRSTSTNMTMTAHRYGKTITFRGVPQRPLPDISGNYYGVGRKARLPFNEILQLSPSGLNRYNVLGVGPNYGYVGDIMVSAKNQIAFFSSIYIGASTNGLIRGITGPYRPSRGTASLKGIMETEDDEEDDEEDAETVDSVSLNIFKQP